MGNIRSYDSPRMAASDSGLNELGGEQTAGNAARGAQQLISGVSDFASAVYNREAQVEVSSAGRQIAEARERWTVNLDHQIRTGQIDVEKVRTDYQTEMDKVAGDITTPEARKFFDAQSLHLRGSLVHAAAEGQAKVAGEKAVADMTMGLNANMNALGIHPAGFKDTYDQTMDSINAQMKSGILDVSEAEKLRTHAGSELAKAVISGEAERNPNNAQRMLRSGQYDAYLSGDTKIALNAHVDAQLRAKQDQTEKLLALKDKNPWEFLQKTGQAGAATPLDFGDGVASSFQKRQEFIDSMDKKQGLQLPFMSEREADHTSRAILAMQPDQAVQAFSNIANGAQDQQSSKFAFQLFKKEPALAAAMMISGDAPDDSRKIIAGMKLIRGAPGTGGAPVRAPGDSEIALKFDAYIGNAIEDPQTREASRQAIAAHMTKSMFDSGKDDFREFTAEEFNKSAKAVMGPVININGAKVMSFKDKKGQFYDQNSLSDLVDGLTDKRIESVQGDLPRTMSGEPINMEKSRGRIQLKSAGDGLYYMLRDSKPAWDKDRRPFVLNLKKLSGVQVTPDKNAQSLPGDYGL